MDTNIGLNSLDFIVLAVIVLSGLLALLRGFVREVLSLLCWVGAYYVASKFYPLAEPYMHRYFKSHTSITMSSGVIVFLLALVTFSIIAFLLARLIKGQALTAIDRSLGFIFGVLRGALVVCIVFMAASVYWPNLDKTKTSETTSLPVSTHTETLHTENTKDVNDDKKNQAPNWLVKAKVYPALVLGANTLRGFLPEKELDKTDKQYQQEKAAAEKLINEKALDLLSIPGTALNKVSKEPAYDNKDRTDLNNVVKQKANP